MRAASRRRPSSHDTLELGEIERLRHHALSGQSECTVEICVRNISAADEDDVGCQLTEMFEDPLEDVDAAFLSQPHVENDAVEALGLEHRERFGDVAGREDDMPSLDEPRSKRAAERLFVVYIEDPGHKTPSSRCTDPSIRTSELRGHTTWSNSVV